MTYWIHSDPEQADTDGQRPCALEGRCIERDHQGQPKLGPRNFCGSDRDLIGRCLAWLPEAYVKLHGMIGDKGSGQGERVSSSRTPAVPINLEVDALLTDIAAILEEWANRVRPIARLYQPAESGRRESVIVSDAVKALSGPRFDALLALPPAPMVRFLTLAEAADLTGWAALPTGEDRRHAPELDGTDAGIEILHLHRRARAMLGMNPKHIDLPVPCWQCDMKAVRRWDGSAGLEDQAECTACGEKYDHERYTLLIRQVAEQQQATGARRKASA